jgi:hemolysin III
VHEPARPELPPDAARREGGLLRRSSNTEHALTAVRPRLRGTSHLVAAILAWPATVVWVLSTPGARASLALTSFGVGIATMLTCSALFHLRRWDAATYERLFRLDHTGIYLAIGGSGVAMGLLGFEGVAGTVLVVGMLVGTGVGVVVEWLPFAPPRGFSNTVYLTLGWLPVVLLPWLWFASGPLVVALLLAGGVLYTVGAVIVALRRPDPSPTWFGYHELFHLCVLGAVACHAVMLERLVDR